MLVASDFADSLKTAMGFASSETSVETLGLATAIINEIKGATFSHLLVTGAATDGAGLLNGSALAGVIVGLTPPGLSGKMKNEMAKPSITAHLLAIATAIVTEILKAPVNFSPGKITGTCAAGAFVGSGINGIVSPISSSAMALSMSSSLGGASDKVTSMCDGISSYIMSNADGAYAPSQVSGAYTSPSGPMTGVGVGGTIS